MAFASLQGDDGRFLPGNPSGNNPAGINQFSPGGSKVTPRAQTQHVLDCAAQRHITPFCADSYGEKVAHAIAHIDEEGQLDIVKFALGVGVLERLVADAGHVEPPAGDAPSSGSQLTELASKFGALRPSSVGPDRKHPGSNGNGGAA